jgi:hypothetical protein
VKDRRGEGRGKRREKVRIEELEVQTAVNSTMRGGES